MIPIYSEKKAVSNTNSTTVVPVFNNSRNNRVKGFAESGSGSLTKVMRISYELPESMNDFVNIEKEEDYTDRDSSPFKVEGDQEDSSGVFPRAVTGLSKSSLMINNHEESISKEGDKTEV